MNEVEEFLLKINKFKEKQHFSLDIYYNDLDNTFVCKLHNFGEELNEKMYFRNAKLVDSLLDAYNYCKNNL